MSVDEELDVVDEKDNLTGQIISYSLAHKDYIPHRIAAVLVFRANGTLLVQVHKHHNRMLDHSVGGHVMAGETYEVAAKREMEEELGLKAPITKVATGIVSKEYYPKQKASLIHILSIFTAKS